MNALLGAAAAAAWRDKAASCASLSGKGESEVYLPHPAAGVDTPTDHLHLTLQAVTSNFTQQI